MNSDATVSVFRLGEHLLVQHMTRDAGGNWVESNWERRLHSDADDTTIGQAAIDAMSVGPGAEPNTSDVPRYPRALGVATEGEVLEAGQYADVARRRGGPIHVSAYSSHGRRGGWESTRHDFTTALETPDAPTLGAAIREALDSSGRIPLPDPSHT